MSADEREAKLPGWAQTIIRNLRRDNGLANEQNQELRAENDRLRGLVDGRAGSDDDSDTFFTAEAGDEPQDLPLGRGTYISFADIFTVHYGTEEITGEKKALIVETRNGDMVIRPTFDPRTIVIEAAKEEK